MYSALIIDDESDARVVLKRLLELFCPEVTTVVEAKTANEALARAKEADFDLAFIDIKLRGQNGLELAHDLIDYCPNLIFVTAYQQYAAGAYRTEAIDYLLKPINPAHLQKAIERADLATPAAKSPKQRILLSTKAGLIVLQQQDIIRVEGDGNYCTFYCQENQHYLVSKNLAYYEDKLDADRFYRVHQTHLINLAAVRRYNTQGRPYAIMSNEKSVPIARRRKDGFVTALQAFNQ